MHLFLATAACALTTLDLSSDPIRFASSFSGLPLFPHLLSLSCHSLALPAAPSSTVLWFLFSRFAYRAVFFCFSAIHIGVIVSAGTVLVILMLWLRFGSSYPTPEMRSYLTATASAVRNFLDNFGFCFWRFLHIYIHFYFYFYPLYTSIYLFSSFIYSHYTTPLGTNGIGMGLRGKGKGYGLGVRGAVYFCLI